MILHKTQEIMVKQISRVMKITVEVKIMAVILEAKIQATVVQIMEQLKNKELRFI